MWRVQDAFYGAAAPTHMAYLPARCSAHSHLRRLCGRAAPLALPAARDASAAGLQPLDPRVWFAPHVPRSGGGHRLARGVGGQTRACWVVYRIEMESVPRAHGVLTFSPSTISSTRYTARLGISAVGGGTRITRMLAPSQSYTENRSIRFLNECPCHVHVRHVNSPYTKEHRPSINAFAECIT